MNNKLFETLTRLFEALTRAFSVAIPCHLVCETCGEKWKPEGRDRQCPDCEGSHAATEYWPSKRAT